MEENGAWHNDYVAERVRKVISKFTEGETTELGIETVTKILTNEDPQMEAPRDYTAENAGNAIAWKVEDLVRELASKHGLDRSEVHRQVFRRVTLASLRLRDRPLELVKDVQDVCSEYKMSTPYAVGPQYRGSGCD